MVQDYLVPWLNASGQDGLRNSMLVAPGDGSTAMFSINFAGGYISKDNVKAYTFNPATGVTAEVPITAGMWTGPNQITLPAPVPVGQYIVIYRDTPKGQPLVNFSTGAILNEPNLDLLAEQAVYIAAEMADRFDLLNDGSSLAIINSASALNTANTALAKSGTAIETADGATVTANAATGTANAAKATADASKLTADDAKQTADGIDTKATQALTNSTEALNTANAIDTKAQEALDNSTNALSVVGTANQNASAALAAAASVSGKADTAVSTANAASGTATVAKNTADAANALAATKLAKAGDTMTGPLLSAATTGALGAFRTVGEIGGSFVDWANSRTFAVQVDAPNSGSAYGGIRWTRWSGRHLAAIDAYEGGTTVTQPSIVMHVGAQNNAWTFSNSDIARGAGGAVWGSWNFDPNTKVNRGGDSMSGELGVITSGDQGFYGRYGPGYMKLARFDYGGYIDLARHMNEDYAWRIHYQFQDATLQFMRNGGQYIAFSGDGNILCSNRGWVWDAINGKAVLGAQCPHNSGVLESAAFAGGGGQTVDMGSPWVCQGMRTTTGAGWQWIRAVALRNQ